MRKYGFAWPDRMQCDKFPNFGDPQNLCMDARNGSLPPPTITPPPSQLLPLPPESIEPMERPKQRPGLIPSKINCKGPNKRLCSPDELMMSTGSSCECQCRPPLIRLGPNDGRYNRSSSLSVGGIPNCLLPCSSPFFSEDEQWFASLWIALWAAIAALSSALTFATFLIDRPRFRYVTNQLRFAIFPPLFLCRHRKPNRLKKKVPFFLCVGFQKTKKVGNSRTVRMNEASVTQ